MSNCIREQQQSIIYQDAPRSHSRNSHLAHSESSDHLDNNPTRLSLITSSSTPTNTTSSSSSSSSFTKTHDHYILHQAYHLPDPSCPSEELAQPHLDSPRTKLTLAEQKSLFNSIHPHLTTDEAPPQDQSSNSDNIRKPHHIPLPIKIYPNSYRRSISAPYTSAGIVSLDFPPARLDSINEDGAIPASSSDRLVSPAAMNYIHPLQTPMPYGGPNDSRDFPTMKSSGEISPIRQFLDQLSPTYSNPPELLSTHPSSASSHSDHMYRKWSGNFYVWVYDSPSTPPTTTTDAHAQSSSPMTNTTSSSSSTTTTTTTPTTTTTLNLSNNLIGGLSKHFFQHSKSPNPNNPSSSESSSKSSKLLAGGKKDRRGKLSLITGLTRQKETASFSQLETVGATNLYTQKPHLDPHSLSEQLDALADRSAIDTVEISKLNQARFQKVADHHHHQQLLQPTKSKKLAFNADSKMNRKKLSSDSANATATATANQASVTSQLSLGPGAAMNSQGAGSGQWKLVQGVITEDGHFTLYTSNDAVLYRIYLPSYRRTDIHMVHQSIFGRPHCGVITRRTGSAAPPAAQSSHLAPSMLTSSSSLPLHAPSSPLPPPTGSLPSLAPSSFAPHHPGLPSLPLPNLPNHTHKDLSSQQQMDSPLGGSPELSVYICMPNSVLLESWLVICKCFCRPDDFRHLYPRSAKKTQVKFTRIRVQSLTENTSELLPSPALHHGASSDRASVKSASHSLKQQQAPPERVRLWRGVEIQLVEGKKLGEVRQMAVHTAATDISAAAGAGVASNGSNKPSLRKDDRRNSTGGFLPTGSQISLLSMNKDALFNKPSSFVGKLDDPDHPPVGFQFNRQSIPAPPATNGDDKPLSTPTTATTSTTTTTTTTTNGGDISTHSSKHNSLALNPLNDHFYFVEFDWDTEIIGRSTIKRNSNPFWSESFKFSEIGSFKIPLILNVYQIKKVLNPTSSKSSHSNSNHSHSNSANSSSTTPSQITLIGQIHLDFKAFEKNGPVQLWLPIHSKLHHSSNDTTGADENVNHYDTRDMNGQRKVDIIGELNLSINVFEQVVLAEPEYAKMSHFLNNDDDIELPLNLANMAVGELDRLSELLIRIYEANNRLFLRFSQLAAIEISGDLSTASILFRANTLLTKMLEAYMRIVGRSFLESSVGPVIRRICMTKVELEIDPAKLKSSLSSHQKDKTINENGKELKKVANEIWQSIYINRSRCPTPLRKIFAKIQGLVGDAYDDQDMRLTSISAFVFLRFFVPAILNPRLFNVIQFQPDSKSQRTLTLIAKTLQGLGNLTLFGIKEPWMSMMNEFITTQLDSFRDYISYIASESDSTKPEWTSKEYEGYGLPYALRASLPASSRDGIPTLPHLLDPVRDYSLLASLIAITKRKSSAAASSSSSSSKHHSSVLPPKTTTKFAEQPGVRSRRYTETGEPMEKVSEPSRPSSTTEFLKVCGDLHAKSERRYLKIIQSESKDPSSSANNINKASLSSAASNTTTTTTTTAATRTTTASSSSSAHNRDSLSTYSPPMLSSSLTTPTSQRVSPQTSQINSRKWLHGNSSSSNSSSNNHNNDMEQLELAKPPLTARSSSTGSSSSSTHNARWKRSYTITAEQSSSGAGLANHHHHHHHHHLHLHEQPGDASSSCSSSSAGATTTTTTTTTVATTTTPTTTAAASAAAMVTGRFSPGGTFGMGAGRSAMVRMDSDTSSSPSSSPTVPPRRYHHHPHQQQHLHQLPAPSSESFESDLQSPKRAPVSPTRTRLNTLIARASPQAHLPPDPPTIPTAPLFAAGYSHPQHPHPHSYQQQQSGLRDSPRSPRPAPSATALAQNQTHMLHHHLHMLHRHHSLRTHHPDPRDDPRSSPSSSPAHVN